MKGASSSVNHLSVDEFYLSALHDKEEIFPISDEIYAEELMLQEALMSSSISSRVRTKTSNHRTHKSKKQETGESSRPSFCEICMDAKTKQEMFTNNQCSHSFCKDCMANYVASKIQENISMIRCPDINCKGLLEPQNCRSLVPKQVFNRWEAALSESFILGLQNFYCPLKDCSVMLVDDGREVVRESLCPYCHRPFCAQCNVSWHEGMGCREFQKQRKGQRKKEDAERMSEDVILNNLANKMKWRRCPNCKFYVEKVEGCQHITCRLIRLI